MYIQILKRGFHILICALCFIVLACKKNDVEFPASGVIVGYDKRAGLECKGKLLVIINKKVTGYLNSGYANDTNYQIQNYPSQFSIDSNSRFPISVLLNFKIMGPSPCGINTTSIDVSKMVR